LEARSSDCLVARRERNRVKCDFVWLAQQTGCTPQDRKTVRPHVPVKIPLGFPSSNQPQDALFFKILTKMIGDAPRLIANHPEPREKSLNKLELLFSADTHANCGNDHALGSMPDLTYLTPAVLGQCKDSATGLKPVNLNT
jgi:hypothetical protein